MLSGRRSRSWQAGSVSRYEVCAGVRVPKGAGGGGLRGEELPDKRDKTRQVWGIYSGCDSASLRSVVTSDPRSVRPTCCCLASLRNVVIRLFPPLCAVRALHWSQSSTRLPHAARTHPAVVNRAKILPSCLASSLSGGHSRQRGSGARRPRPVLRRQQRCRAASIVCCTERGGLQERARQTLG